MEKVHSYHRRIEGKVRPVSGYTRPERHGKKKIVGKKQFTFVPVRDENGEWRGLKRVVKRK